MRSKLIVLLIFLLNNYTFSQCIIEDVSFPIIDKSPILQIYQDSLKKQTFAYLPIEKVDTNCLNIFINKIQSSPYPVQLTIHNKNWYGQNVFNSEMKEHEEDMLNWETYLRNKLSQNLFVGILNVNFYDVNDFPNLLTCFELNENIWKVSISVYFNNGNQIDMFNSIPNIPNLREVSISQNKPLKIIKELTYNTNIESISIEAPSVFISPYNLKKLESLKSVYIVAINNIPYEIIDLPSITTVDLHINKSLTDRDFNKIEGFQKIELFKSFSCISNKNDYTINAFKFQNSNNIVSIYKRSFRSFPKYLLDFKQMSTLKIKCNEFKMKKIESKIATLTNLKSIEIFTNSLNEETKKKFILKMAEINPNIKVHFYNM